MIKHTLITIITVISIVGCGGGGGGSEEPTTPTSSTPVTPSEPVVTVAPVAPEGFTYKTAQDLTLEIDVDYFEQNDFNTSAQRQIIIYHKVSQDDVALTPGEVLSNEALINDEVLKDSVIKPDELFTTSLNLGNHIDEITISIPSLFYECVFTVSDLMLVEPDCDMDNDNRIITVNKSSNEGY